MIRNSLSCEYGGELQLTLSNDVCLQNGHAESCLGPKFCLEGRFANDELNKASDFHY